MEAKQATLHHELIAQLLDSRIPKTEREHAAAREIERLRADLLQELVDAPEAEPVLVVEVEPDYWHRGHYCEGTKSYIDPTKVWGLPVGTKLYTAPPAPSVPELLTATNPAQISSLAEPQPPAPSVPDGWKHDCAGILANDVELWLDSCPHCGKPRPAAAPTPAEAPADVARDAERYRWLRTHGLQRAWVSLGTDFEGDNFASFRCEFNLPEPPNLPYEDDEGLQWADKDFDAAIDAAIEREILGSTQ